MDDLVGYKQKALSLKINPRSQYLLRLETQRGDERELVRVTSLSLPPTGDWLNVVPNPALGLHLKTLEITMSARYKLGLDIFSLGLTCSRDK